MCKIAKGLGIILIFIGPIVGMSLWGLYFTWFYWQLHTDLESRGVSTQALVIECRHNHNSYDIIYEFEVEEGGQTDNAPPTKQTYRIKEGSSRSRCYERKGTMIDIKYMLEDPTRSSSEGEAERTAKSSCYMSLIPSLLFVFTIFRSTTVQKKIVE